MMNKTFKSLIAIAAVAIFASGCTKVTVSPHERGKILSANGFEPELYQPGKYWVSWWNEMVFQESQTSVFTEKVPVKTTDRATVTVDIRFRGRIKDNPEIIQRMFVDIPAGPDRRISFGEAYNVYGRDVIRTVTRSIVSKYSAQDVQLHYDRISADIAAAIGPALAKGPIQVSNITVGNVVLPEAIQSRIDGAIGRQADEEKAKADAAILLIQKDNERLLAEADYQVKMAEAKAIRDYNRTIGEGITDELLELKRLEVTRLMAEAAKSGGASTVFMPVEGLVSPGAQMRMFQK
jgi:regulator of protease activity HflC (stomatin/prohibitin superfamily)